MVSEYGGLVDVQDGHKMVSSSRKYINFKSTNHQFQGLELEGRLHDFMSTKYIDSDTLLSTYNIMEIRSANFFCLDN